MDGIALVDILMCERCLKADGKVFVRQYTTCTRCYITKSTKGAETQ